MEAEINRTRDPDQVQSKPGQVTHGGYSLRRLVRLSKPGQRRDREMVDAARLAYAVAKGYPSWESCPQPVREMIDMAIELSLFRRALFSGFWRGAEIPKRYDGVCEILRRVLLTFGLDPQATSPDVAALLVQTAPQTKPAEGHPAHRRHTGD